MKKIYYKVRKAIRDFFTVPPLKNQTLSSANNEQGHHHVR
jgi:hypothetical protein